MLRLIHFRRCLLAIGWVLSGLSAGGAQAAGVTIQAAQWTRPPAGVGLTTQAPLRQVIHSLDRDPALRLAIRYPGGDAGSAWALEVRDWLVALGVASSRMELQPGSGAADAIVIETLLSAPY